MTHVFIVNDITFKYHLEYMFAGTGASVDAPFLEDANYQNSKRKADGLTPPSERNITAMIADISRIQSGDKIIFYLSANKNHEGMFYGIFKATSAPFYDSNDSNFLSLEMGKKLNFRVKIEPDEVYGKGVSEHKALDVLEGIDRPSEMCWSLIYRKLKGNRGCTMITDYESSKLISKIRAENSGKMLCGTTFSFDTTQGKIIPTDEVHVYKGTMKPISIKDRLLVKYKNGKAFETHLQAYIVQNYLNEHDLVNLLNISAKRGIWIGNEVSCGVGMQRIDLVTVQECVDDVIINIIELKDEEPYNSIITYQLPWYIDWVINYWCPLYANKRVIINPVVIAKKTNETNCKQFQKLAKKLKYTLKNNVSVSDIKYISFEINDNISFKKVF